MNSILLESAQTKCLAITSGSSHFFGFHDLSPWDPGGEEMVCLRAETPEDHVPHKKDTAEVCIVEESSGAARCIGATNAWNWQQGARQQWYVSGGQRSVIFNTAVEGALTACIVDAENGDTRFLDGPIFDIHAGRGYGLAVNFGRLHEYYTSYGYDVPFEREYRSDSKDGIFRVDLDSGKKTLLFSISEFLELSGIDSGSDRNFFTHISIAPDGQHYCFLHRQIKASGAVLTNLVVANMESGKWWILADDKVSHFDWADNDTIVAWCRSNPTIKKLKKSAFVKLVRPLYQLSRRIRNKAVRQVFYGETFKSINIHTRKMNSFGQGVITEDGHPQVCPFFKDIWVNDTYPDQDGYQTLMLYNSAKRARVDIGKFHTPDQIRDTGWRCDLHPRWHPSAGRICIDSSHSGRRQLYVVDVQEAVSELLSD